MTYQEMLAYLDGLGRFGMKLTLDRIRALLDLLGHPEERLRAVHVAGTNGKGSTVALLDAILQAGGYTTGRWTYPHLVDFRERIMLGGRPIAPELLVEAFARVRAAVEQIKDGPTGHPTQFEVGTAMAFLLLAEADPDLSLIEVGLGGRHDTTNVLSPLVTIVTHLALDHTDRLGADLASIAAEKAGTIKPGRPVAIAPQEPEALAVLLAEADRQGAPVSLVGRNLVCRLDEASAAGTFCEMRGGTDYGRVRVNLLGAHQADNAAVAVAAAEILSGQGYPLAPAAIRRGLDTAVWPGRLELVSRKPLVVLDGAHNPDGMRALARALPEVFRRERFDFLLGILDNRPVEEMAGLLTPLARRVVVTTVPGGTAPSADISRVASAFGPSGIKVESVPDPAAALERALNSLPAGGMLCVCGSLYLVGTIRGLLRVA